MDKMDGKKSSLSSDPHVSYDLVNKVSGCKVGVVILCETGGQEIPDLGQMELRTSQVEDLEPAGGVSALGHGTDMNANKPADSESMTTVQSLLMSRYEKPAKFGWIRKVIIRSSDTGISKVTYWSPKLEGKRLKLATCMEAKQFLEENDDKILHIDNFCYERKVLGISSLELVKIDVECYMKPMEFGWTRNVTVRSSDQKVTSVGYMTPPDSEGNRKRFAYKKDIEKYLKKTGNSNVEIDDFLVMRRVLGFPPEHEMVKYSEFGRFEQQARETEASKSSDTNYSKTVYANRDIFDNYETKVTSNRSPDSSYDTLTDDSCSSSESSSDSSNEGSFEDSNDDTNDCYKTDDKLRESSKLLVSTEPQPTSYPLPHSSTLITPSSLPESVTKTNIMQQPTTRPALSPSVEGSPPTVTPSAMSTMLMILSCPSGGEDIRRQHKMCVKNGVKVGKGMKKFSAKFGLNMKKLKCYADGKELTGDELAEELDGATIRVNVVN